MNNVIAITDQADWNTLSCLSGSINYYKQNNGSGRYDKALDREGAAYKSYLKKYITSPIQENRSTEDEETTSITIH